MVHFFDCFFKNVFIYFFLNHYINNKGTDNKHLKHIIMSLIIVLFLSKTPNFCKVLHMLLNGH